MPSFPQFRPGTPQPAGQPQGLAQAKPTFRMQAPEEPELPRQSLSLPPPEQLGIPVPGPAAVPAANVDWNATKQQMDQLGIVGYHCARLPQGGVRITLVVPISQGMRHVEAEAASEAAAVISALQRVQSLRGS